MLFPSSLLISSDISSVNPFLLELGHTSVVNNPDILLINEYTIENIRNINIFLSISPYNHSSKVIIIPDAHLLNLDSQNTLLKNLEEPGTNNYFFLLTPRPNSLINTILSRCHLIKVNKNNTTTANILKFPTSIDQSLLASDLLPKDKTELSNYLNDQIFLYQQQLATNPEEKTAQIINRLIKATQMITANIDTKSVSDFLLLS